MPRPTNPQVETAVLRELGVLHECADAAARIEHANRAAIIADYIDATEGADNAESNQPHQRRGD